MNNPSRDASRNTSHFPAVAGTALGLMAAAVGAWFLYPQHLGPGAGAHADGAPAAQLQVSQQRIPQPVPQPVQGQAGQNAGLQPGQQAAAVLTREQAEERLMALPELQAWARRIEQASGGRVHGALVAFDAAPREVAGKRYHVLDFVENRPEAAIAWERFLVGTADGDILVDDAEHGSALTLQRWRAEHRPLERAAASRP